MLQVPNNPEYSPEFPYEQDAAPFYFTGNQDCFVESHLEIADTGVLNLLGDSEDQLINRKNESNDDNNSVSSPHGLEINNSRKSPFIQSGVVLGLLTLSFGISIYVIAILAMASQETTLLTNSSNCILVSFACIWSMLWCVKALSVLFRS